MANFFEERAGRAEGGWCAAFDRAEAARCEFYKAGKDGFCAHTLRRLESIEGGWRIKGREHVFEPVKKRRLEQHVTGDCYSDEAAREYARKGKSTGGKVQR